MAFHFSTFTEPFAEQKSFVLLKSNLSIFSYMGIAFYVVSKKYLPFSGSWKLFPIFSSKSFVIWHFTLRSVIYFELIFFNILWDIGWGLYNFFFADGCPVVIAYFIIKTIISSWILFLLKVSCPYFTGQFLDSSLFYGSMCLSFHQYYVVLTTVPLKIG